MMTTATVRVRLGMGLRSLADALEARFPPLRHTVRDPATGRWRSGPSRS